MKKYFLEVITGFIPLGCLLWLLSGVYVHFYKHVDKTSQILLFALCVITTTTAIITFSRLKSFSRILCVVLFSFLVFFWGQHNAQYKENVTIQNINYLQINPIQKNIKITVNRLLYESKKSKVYDVKLETFDLPARLTSVKTYHQNDRIVIDSKIGVKNNKKRLIVNIQEEKLVSVQPSRLGLYSGQLQTYLSSLYQKYLKDETLGIVEGIVLGMQTHIPFWFNNLFRDVGISHIIVLSGYNIILVYEGLFLIFGKFLSKNHVTVISLLFAYMLVMIAGNTQASQRAYQSIMIHEGLRILKILPSIEKTILYIITIVVVMTGEIISSHLGLLLSCGATLGIVLSMRLFNYFKRVYDFSKFTIYVGNVVVTTIGAWCGTLPLVIAFFGVATPSGMIMSILVLPLVFLYTVFGIGFLLLAMFEQYVPFIHNILNSISWLFTKATNIIMMVAVSVRYHIQNISVNEYQSLYISLGVVILFCIIGYSTLPHHLFKSRFNGIKV